MDIPSVFSDLEPLPQDEGEEPVVRIAYPPGFETAMSYFRRVLVNGEYSERTLQLTGEVIGHNAANYTAWLFRRRCLTELYGRSAAEGNLAAWQSELAYTTEMIDRNMKNYQVWHHRRAVVEALNDGSQELAFVRQVFIDGGDAKNYHAWGHRQWVLRTFGGWEAELDYVEELLQQDLRNNSAWNQRFYVLQHTAVLKELDAMRAEVAYALRYIEAAPNNPSPWHFLKGVAEPLGLAQFPEIRQACERLAAASESGGGEEPAAGACTHALSMLLDILSEEGASTTSRATALCRRALGPQCRPPPARPHLGSATEMIPPLHGRRQLKELDPIRAPYWQWRLERLAPAVA